MPDEPGVDGSEGELAMLGAGSRPRDVVEDPPDLGGGEVGVDDEAGLRGDSLARAGLLEGAACGGGAAILPYDCRVDGLAGGAVPDDDGLALVGDADCGDVARAGAGLAQGFDGAGHLAGEDLHGIVLDPAGLRVELLELLLRDGGDGAGLVEEDGAGACCALIEGEDVGHWSLLSALVNHAAPSRSNLRHAIR